MIGNLKSLKLIFLIFAVLPTLHAFWPISSEISLIWSKVSNQAEKVNKKISTPFKNVSENKEKEVDSTNLTKEHGQLDFFGRDVVRSIQATINKAEKRLLTAPSEGLDLNKTFFNGIMDEFKKNMKLIFPGTLWCGGGNAAENNTNKLGLFYQTDNCCREHDNCKDSIDAGETRSGLINTGLFVRSHCKCDMEFRNCLKKVDSLISLKIGITYFTVLGPQCFKNDYPIIKCNKKNVGRCIDYELDLTGDKFEQWFDNSIY